MRPKFALPIRGLRGEAAAGDGKNRVRAATADEIFVMNLNGLGRMSI